MFEKLRKKKPEPEAQPRHDIKANKKAANAPLHIDSANGLYQTPEKGLSSLLQVAGDRTRRKILFMLSGKYEYPAMMAKRLEISETAVHRHLATLKSAGLVQKIESNPGTYERRVFYELTNYGAFILTKIGEAG